jgi:hypothetical protein
MDSSCDSPRIFPSKGSSAPDLYHGYRTRTSENRAKPAAALGAFVCMVVLLEVALKGLRNHTVRGTKTSSYQNGAWPAGMLMDLGTPPTCT